MLKYRKYQKRIKNYKKTYVWKSNKEKLLKKIFLKIKKKANNKENVCKAIIKSKKNNISLKLKIVNDKLLLFKITLFNFLSFKIKII